MKFGVTIKLLTAALIVAGTALFGAEGLTDFQKRIPGPKKLAMSVGDYSGTVNTDPQFIADRL